MIIIPQNSDMFSKEWLIIYVEKYGKDNVFIKMDENKAMFIQVNESQNEN